MIPFGPYPHNPERLRGNTGLNDCHPSGNLRYLRGLRAKKSPGREALCPAGFTAAQASYGPRGRSLSQIARGQRLAWFGL